MIKQAQQFLKRIFKNSTTSLGNTFLRYGNNKPILPRWNDVEISDRDFYTGYSYSAIKKRANATARLAPEVTVVESKKENLQSPHIQAISTSPHFSESDFWRVTSTYLDLEGVAYLFVLRGQQKDVTGNIVYAKLLNSYLVKRVTDDNGNLGGYVEFLGDGRSREIPPHMIIEFREFNPFVWDENLAIVDAAKNQQYQLRTASNYTTKSMNASKNAPYIVSTDVKLPTEDFENFVARVKGSGTGEPIFGNGAGAISAQALPNNLKDAALKDINEITRDELLSTYGTSKTIMGIEQSGTTRETAKVQKDLFYEFETIPRIQGILDTFNLDYVNNYPKEFERTNLKLIATNPTTTDHEGDIKLSELRKKDFELYTQLIEEGYSIDKAARFVIGEISLKELGQPKKKVEPAPQTPENHIKGCGCGLHKHSNQIETQQSSLQVGIVNIERQLFTTAVERIGKKFNNAIDLEEDDVLTKTQKDQYIRELAALLTAFYLTIALSNGAEKASDNLKNLGYSTIFTVGVDIRTAARKLAKEVADSHIHTITGDIYKTAQEAIAAGMNQEEVISTLTKQFAGEISTQRAQVIARTEANRALANAWYYADEQLIEQNGLWDQAYKRWVTTSDNPCEFCLALEAEGEVPFGDPFRREGQSVRGISGKTFDVNFGDVDFGILHPNCMCYGELVIRPA